jgi:glycosyltransferase involved in cell wall biosynthesis
MPQHEAPMPVTTPAIWGLDVLQLRQGSVFASGWLYVPAAQLTSLSLQLRSQDKNEESQLVGQITLVAGKNRPDVLQAHAQHPAALNCGFVGVGTWPRQPRKGDQLVLAARFSSMESISVRIPTARWHWMLSPSLWQQRKAGLRQLLRYGRRALMLLVSGQWASLQEKLSRQLEEAPHEPLSPQLTSADLLALGASKEGKVHLIVDHRLGGGANHYRQELVQHWLDQGSTVLTLTYHLAKLQPMLVVNTSQQQKRFGLEKISDLLTALATIPVASITYNTAVSFVGAESLPELLISVKQKHQAKLTVLLHDYFCICPSHFLLDANGQFCDIPDPSICRQCLPINTHGFTSLFQGDVTQWRQAWAPMLQQADELVAFSQSSIDLLKKAYPNGSNNSNGINYESIILRPHKTGHSGKVVVNVCQTEQLVIGVVGQIGFHKGAAFIQQLARTIEQQGSPDRIAIIGNLEARANSNIVRQTGTYQRHQLASAIQSSGANVMLFPSIWPETFSYVTQEIMELNLPLACFNYGAPAERIREYSKGLVLISQEPTRVLEDLRQLFRANYH